MSVRLAERCELDGIVKEFEFHLPRSFTVRIICIHGFAKDLFIENKHNTDNSVFENGISAQCRSFQGFNSQKSLRW